MKTDVEAAAAPSCRFRAGVVAYCSIKNSSRTKATMTKISVCVAALVGLAGFLPSQSWSQATKQAKPAVTTALLAADRYGDARELERAGHWAEAVQAYHELAARGHGPAQKKLGDIYGSGHGDVQRDYETSLRWYQRAREQGMEIPQPFSYPGVRR
jgi:Sel1 repeat-containing protein